ncbi:MAG: TetR/AcrR family transcriptional regulator [Microthrixaceae bacterium]
MGRTTKDERRRHYLDIGAQLVADSATGSAPDPGLALAHVKVADVAERAGVTKGALYHLWPSQEDYWNDLLHFLLEQDRLSGESDVADILATATGLTDGAADPWSYADLLFERFRDDASYLVRVSLHSYLYDEEIRVALDREFRTAISRFSDVIAEALRIRGRRLIPGATTEDLVVALTSLLQGMCLEHRIDPDRAPTLELDGATRGLFSVGAEALVLALTEPDDGPAVAPGDGG